MLQTKEEYISEIEEALKVLQEILVEFEKIKHHNTQTLLFHYFASRAAKIGSAALRVLDLDVPFAILCRVLCEDFISLYWVAQSAQNAEYYTKRSLREMGKRATILISRFIEDKKRKGQSVVGVSVEPFQKMTPKMKSKTLADMAKEVGLEALYDHVYRGTSSDVHGHQWGMFRIDLKNLELLVLSYLSTLLVLTVGFFNHGQKVITPKVVLEEFGLES
jgi:urease gamma subunit